MADALQHSAFSTGARPGSRSYSVGFTPGRPDLEPVRPVDPSYTKYLIDGRPIANYPALYNGTDVITSLAGIPTTLIDGIDILPGGAVLDLRLGRHRRRDQHQAEEEDGRASRSTAVTAGRAMAAASSRRIGADGRVTRWGPVIAGRQRPVREHQPDLGLPARADAASTSPVAPARRPWRNATALVIGLFGWRQRQPVLRRTILARAAPPSANQFNGTHGSAARAPVTASTAAATQWRLLHHQRMARKSTQGYLRLSRTTSPINTQIFGEVLLERTTSPALHRGRQTSYKTSKDPQQPVLLLLRPEHPRRRSQPTATSYSPEEAGGFNNLLNNRNTS